MTNDPSLHPATHCMREDQALLRLEGPPNQPGGMLSLRAGEADYDGKGQARQRSRSLAARPGLEETLQSIKRRAISKLSRFDGRLKLQALVRERRVDLVPGACQPFAGVWGTLTVPGQWNTAFGTAPNGELLFRRGPWEDWSPELPRLKSLDLGLPLVFSPYCATLFHEAVGHALEAEYLEGSPLKYYRGDRIANSGLTIMDSPDLEGYAGSMSHDDCGAPASQTTLIQSGILVGNLASGKGVWRRASYRELPLIRASNFVIGEGKADPSSWLQVERCYYVAWVRSGNWRPGDSAFKVLTGPIFLLERGRPVGYRGWASLRFTTLNLLRRIAGVGRDFTMDPVVHWCLKKNQVVPMSMGSPSILVEGYAP